MLLFFLFYFSLIKNFFRLKLFFFFSEKIALKADIPSIEEVNFEFRDKWLKKRIYM